MLKHPKSRWHRYSAQHAADRDIKLPDKCNAAHNNMILGGISMATSNRHHYMGAWSYVFLNILYAIPVVGLICLIVHCFGYHKENRMHYARSFFAAALLAVIVVVAIIGIMFLVAGGGEISVFLEEFVDGLR